MKGAGFIGVSVVLHTVMIAALAFDEPARPASPGAPVKIRIVARQPTTEKKLAPRPKPRPKMPPVKSESTVAKNPEAKVTPPLPEPTQVDEDVMPEDAAAAPVPAEDAETATDAPLSASGNDLTEGAQLIIRSFVQPRYTLPARKAGYEVEFTAEVLVNRSGRATEVKFDKQILYEMDERIIQSIRRASYKPAKNRLGMAVDSWLRIPFRLEMTE